MTSGIKIGNYKKIIVPDNLSGEARDKFIVGQIMRNSDAQVSESEIRNRAVGMFEQFDISLSQQGLSIDEYYKRNNTNEKELMLKFMEHSKRQIKERKVLLHISEIEEIYADEEDYNLYIERISKLYPLSTEKISELLTGKEKLRIVEEITLRKTIDYISEYYCMSN